ncbi:MAG: hypothetical protein Q7J35_12685 [Candidatus Methanoperedens sp.]|nr:hypothetical protein [Candidatus Methanoperedens sp.]
MRKRNAETPIAYVLILLGLISYLATFPVTDMQKESFLVFDVTTVVGIFCIFFTLLLGLKLSIQQGKIEN